MRIVWAQPQKPPKERQLIVSGYAFMSGNVGDQAISAGLIGVINAYAPSHKHLMLTHRSDASVRAKFKRYEEAVGSDTLGLQPFDVDMRLVRSDGAPDIELLNALLKTPALRRRVLETSRIDEADIALLATGELLFSYGTAEDDWRLLGYTLPFLAAAEHGVPYGVLPATYGPFDSEFSRVLIRRLLKHSAFSMSRDANRSHLSEDLLASVEEGLDLAFFMDRKEWSRSWALDPMRKTVSVVPRLEKFGLRMGTASLPFLQSMKSSDYVESDAVAFYVALIQKLVEDDRIKVVLMPQTENDKPIVEAIDARLRQSGADLDHYTVHHDLRIDVYLDRIDRSSVVVTSRLHSMIFAAARGIPSVMAVTEGHGHKSRSMMEMLGMGRNVTDIGGQTEAEVAQVLAQLDSLLSSLSDQIQDLSQRVAEKKRRTLSSLKGFLPG